MKHSYYKIIYFQYFRKSLSEAEEYFQLDVDAYLREEFLKQPVGNSNTYMYDLKENAMSGEFNVMIIQTLKT